MKNTQIPVIEIPLTPEQEAERIAWEESTFERAVLEINAKRRSAYQLESDPIFFQAQREDTYTLDDWKAKVAEIDTRYPYPEQPS